MPSSSHSGTTLTSILRSFVRKEDGNIAVVFGLTLFPLLASVGAAMDYSKASNVRSVLQSALDSTALAMAKRSVQVSDADLRREAELHFRAILSNRPDIAALPLTVTRGNLKVAVAAQGQVRTNFMSIFGIDKVDVATRAEAGIAGRKAEIALALDNTGSMGELNKMEELKRATRNLIDAAEKAAPAGSGLIKMALVPFDTQVRVDPAAYRNESWLAFNDVNSPAFDDIRGKMASKTSWSGCITDRAPGFDTTDKRAELARPESLHPAVNCDGAGLARIQPLTDNWSALRSTADSMKPSGCTNISIGARFGLAALSPDAPIGRGVPFGAKDVDKYLVILTDGDNTKNRYTDACGGAAKATDIDDRTRALCDDIKKKSSAKDDNGMPVGDVKIFTIRVIQGNGALLSNCATGASMYKEVKNASEIDAVFKDIMREITKVKLTM